MKTPLRILILISLVIITAVTAARGQDQQRAKVKNITYSGNTTFIDARLEGLMLTRASRFLAPNRFHPEIFQDDIVTLVSFYRQNGFLQVQITDTVISVDSVENSVDIFIALEEGQRTFVEGVTIFGNEFLADSVLLPRIQTKKGDPLRRPVIEDAVFSLLSLYAEHGFLDASITPKVQVNDTMHLALIDFSIIEGVSSSVGDIDIAGADKTRKQVIRRELSFSQNDTIRYSHLTASQQRLYFTGLFESVFIKPAAPDSMYFNRRNIRVEVKEKPASELSFSVGYGTIEKVRGRAEINTINLAGTARKAGFGIEANFIRQGISTSFSEPWTLGTRWKTDLSIFGQLRQEPGYHAEIIGGKFIIGRKLGHKTTVSISYRLENSNISRIDFTAPVDELDPRIRSLTLAFSHDTRDNLFDPSLGWYLNWANEMAGSFLQGSNSFTKSVLTIKRFQPIGRSTVIGSALDLGWMEGFGDHDEIPVNERFYTGGPTSLRGFGYQMVGPLDENREPMGGQIKLVFNLLEVRRSIYRMIGGAIFFEFGNVWEKPKAIQFSDFRVNLGCGLRVNSPLGILRLDFGINPDRRDDEPQTKVFFSMGQAF